MNYDTNNPPPMRPTSNEDVVAPDQEGEIAEVALSEIDEMGYRPASYTVHVLDGSKIFRSRIVKLDNKNSSADFICWMGIDGKYQVHVRFGVEN